ncbi:MAG: DUF2442 domain-containing protein, partial [bacterium]
MSHPDLTVLLDDPQGQEALPLSPGARFRVVHRLRAQRAETVKNLFVLSSALSLPDVAEVVSVANKRHRLRALFVRADADASWLPQMFERANLRTLRNTLVHSGPSLPRRVLTAWGHGAQNELIATASLADDSLLVLTCALETLEVRFDQMPALKRIPEDHRSNFEVVEDGSFIHWPEPDIHLDVDAIRTAISPELQEEARGRRRVHDRRYGAAIAAFRKGAGLRQTDISGLS